MTETNRTEMKITWTRSTEIIFTTKFHWEKPIFILYDYCNGLTIFGFSSTRSVSKNLLWENVQRNFCINKIVLMNRRKSDIFKKITTTTKSIQNNVPWFTPLWTRLSPSLLFFFFSKSYKKIKQKNLNLNE